MTTTARPGDAAFLRLDARIGWRLDPRYSQNLVDDARSGGLRLGNADDDPVPLREPSGTFGGRTLPTGVAVHADGSLVLADPAHNQLLCYETVKGPQQRPVQPAPYWPFQPLWRPDSTEAVDPAQAALGPSDTTSDAGTDVGPYRLAQPHDATFRTAAELVVADSGNSRLLCFTWPELRVRQILSIPGSKPVAVVFDSMGRGYVADAASGRVWRFDWQWQLDEAYQGGAGVLRRPEHLTIDLDDNLLVLDAATQTVHGLDTRGRLHLNDAGQPIALAAKDLEGRALPPPFGLSGERLEYPQPGRPGCRPWTLDGVTVDRGGRLAGTSLPLLARPRRIVLPRSGVLLSERLDSGLAGCQWHRLVLDARLEPSTRLLVQTFASDIPLESSRIAEPNTDGWSAPLALTADDVPELLVQSEPGRYLWLRVELSGDGQHTPVIRSIELQAPRRSSLQWLPAPFHSDPDSVHFLDRYLSYFDTVFAEIRYEIENFARMLDPHAVPEGEFLSWLGSWFDWQFLAEWPVETRRELIAASVEFFRQRGTLEGLKRLLQWHTGLRGEQPQIIEHFRVRDYATRRSSLDTDLLNGRLYVGGRPLDPPASQLAHWFTIVVPASVVPDDEARQTLRKLIEAQKPAHTGFELRVIQPAVRIACQSTVGLDTWLGDYPADSLGSMKLGQSSQLAGPPARGLRLAAFHSNAHAEERCS